MLAKITGIWEVIQPNKIVLDVNGMGFAVYCLSSYVQNLAHYKQKQITLWVEPVFTPDGATMYGFHDTETLNWFNRLRTVSGVGSKMALHILDTFSCEDLTAAIQSQNVQTLCTVKGVGKKVASRLVTELQDKIDTSTMDSQYIKADTAVDNDVIDALVVLGYSNMRAWEALRKVKSQMQEDGNRTIDKTDVQSILKKALAYLQGKK